MTPPQRHGLTLGLTVLLTALTTALAAGWLLSASESSGISSADPGESSSPVTSTVLPFGPTTEPPILLTIVWQTRPSPTPTLPPLKPTRTPRPEYVPPTATPTGSNGAMRIGER